MPNTVKQLYDSSVSSLFESINFLLADVSYTEEIAEIKGDRMVRFAISVSLFVKNEDGSYALNPEIEADNSYFLSNYQDFVNFIMTLPDGEHQILHQVQEDGSLKPYYVNGDGENIFLDEMPTIPDLLGA